MSFDKKNKDTRHFVSGCRENRTGRRLRHDRMGGSGEPVWWWNVCRETGDLGGVQACGDLDLELLESGKGLEEGEDALCGRKEKARLERK